MISWLSFEWQTHDLPDFSSLVAPMTIRAAKKSDGEVVARVLKSAFSADSTWGDVNRAVAAKLAAVAEVVFSVEDPHCVVIVHGARVIGASLLDAGAEAPSHLLSGPCILHEYRNRGLASALLAASLDHLCKNDIKLARGITRENSLTARFVYPKFGGVARPYEDDPLLMTGEA
ncbi:MAG: GNAT family N-acetyltransferase [Verrucomicrobiae bacterium]